MAVKLYAHNLNSEGARELATALGIRRLRHEGSRWHGRAADTVINWGHGGVLPDCIGGACVLNSPTAVGLAGNKLRFFEACVSDGGPRIPDWTSDPGVAHGWLDDGFTVVARTILNGHSGIGIVLIENPVDFVQAPLYTKYIKKSAEFRAHILNGEVIDVQKKIRDPDREPTNWKVRNHSNGFIFARNDVVLSDDCRDQALRAWQACGLDFGAVDILTDTTRQHLAYVLEINTAPGLVGQTVENYSNAFKRFLDIL